MKICFLLCGLQRSIHLTIQNIENIFIDNEIYFYISTTMLDESNELEYTNNNDNYNLFNDNIQNIVFVKNYKNNNYRNSLNYTKKICYGIKVIEDIYDLYIILRTDCIIKNINFLNEITNDNIYFPKISKNKFSENINEKINEQIIITKKYENLLKLNGLHNFGIDNNNYLDIIFYNYLKEKKITYNLIDIEYKLILSNCNIIAISGDSGSGKTTFSEKLLKIFNKDKVLKFETDRYHKCERGDNNYNNYTHLNPYSNKLELFSNDVYNLKIGNEIYQIDYDHSTGKFTKEEKIESKNDIIICGLHTLFLEKLNKIIDLKIFIDTDSELIKEWKIKRDTNERNYTKEKILKQIENRKNDYIKYIKNQKYNSDIIINFYKDNNILQCNLIFNNLNIFKELNKYFVKYNYDIILNNENINSNNYQVTIKLKNEINEINEIYINEKINNYFILEKMNIEEYDNFYYEILIFITIYIYKIKID